MLHGIIQSRSLLPEKGLVRAQREQPQDLGRVLGMQRWQDRLLIEKTPLNLGVVVCSRKRAVMTKYQGFSAAKRVNTFRSPVSTFEALIL